MDGYIYGQAEDTFDTADHPDNLCDTFAVSEFINEQVTEISVVQHIFIYLWMVETKL